MSEHSVSRRLRVGLVLEPTGVENPYCRGAFLGLERAVRELGIRGRVLTPAPKEGFAPSLSLLARQRYDLVVGLGSFAARAIDAVAVRFPNTRFAILDARHEDLEHRPPNVQALAFREQEAAYLAGYLAVLMLESLADADTVSAVGGQPVPAVQKLLGGFVAGASAADPGIRVLTMYTGDFIDTAKGRSAAMGQIAKGSRVVFQAAGPCGLGALEAAGEQGVWAIGVDVDQSSLGPHVLTSAVKRLDIAVFETVRRLVEDTLATGGTSVFALADGGVGLGAFNPRVPRTVLSRIEEVRAGIVAGSVDVELPDQTAQSSFPDGSFATPSGSYPPERIARSP